MRKSLYSLFIIIFIFVFNSSAQERCGTHAPSQYSPVNQLYKLSGTIIIPVIFHVIYKSDGTGNVSEAQLQTQLDSLNYGFSGSRISFSLAGISMTESNTLFNLDYNETTIANTLSIDPKHALNLYIGHSVRYYGLTLKFPWEVIEDSKLHGVFIDYGTLPGGYYQDFNEGNTAVHETGHYVGLYHTFHPWNPQQGLTGCMLDGDEVDDTPPEESPAEGCPYWKLACNYDYAPIHNYMDYSDDPCMYEFTSGQNTRFSSKVAELKPNLGGTSLYITSDFTLESDWKLGQNMTSIIIDNLITIFENTSLSLGANTILHDDIKFGKWKKFNSIRT